MCINNVKIPLTVSCKKDSSIIDKDSYRDELPFLWSLANLSVVLLYYKTSFVHEWRASAFLYGKGDWAVAFSQ